MDLVVNYNRQYRIIDRSMSEAKLADQPFPGDFFIKGQTFRDYSSQISRKETINSYHQGIILFTHFLLSFSFLAVVVYKAFF